MSRQSAVAVVFVGLMLSAGCGSAFNGGPETDDVDTRTQPEGADGSPDEGKKNGTSTTTTADTAPSDPEKDVLGWENGYWYNESIAVDRSDGLNDTELQRIVNRAMARVEQIRRLEFERNVSVRVISRETYAERTAPGAVSFDTRLYFRVKYESRFFITEQQDPIGVLKTAKSNRASAYYDLDTDRIVLVAENTTAPTIEGELLAHELLHALQDQRLTDFEPAGIETFTLEDHNTFDAVIEGDANYVGFLYRQRCEQEWDCLTAADEDSDGLSYHAGIRLTRLAPYSDGPAFLQSVREDGGWEAVNALYENPPESTEQMIHPEKYPEDSPTGVTVSDRSTQEWTVLERSDSSVGLGPIPTSATNMTFGEAGIFAMFWYASYQSVRDGGQSVVVPYDVADSPGVGILSVNHSAQQSPSYYDYNATVTAGWDGDLLVPYVTRSSPRTNETAYVWKTVWDSPEDAQEFRAGYVDLLEYYGAERVGPDTWRLPEDYTGDAVHVVTEGNTTTIVNAPTVEDLSKVRTTVTVQLEE